MTISINNGVLEARVNKAISKMPLTLRPSKQQFVEGAVNSYIDALVRDKVIPSA
tara:strand:- start:19 stop:180 length:162 start_codon:yes stop_codon:yes gene_type:complete